MKQTEEQYIITKLISGKSYRKGGVIMDFKTEQRIRKKHSSWQREMVKNITITAERESRPHLEYANSGWCPDKVKDIVECSKTCHKIHSWI